MAIKELNDFIFENYYRRIRFTKKTVIVQRDIRRKKICYCLLLNQ